MTFDEALAIVKPHNDKAVAEAKLADAQRLIAALVDEVELWKSRYEAADQALTATIKDFNEITGGDQ